MKLQLLVVSFIFWGFVFGLPSGGRDGVESVKFDPDKDVRFFLYTRKNPTVPQEINYRDIESVRASNYDKNKGLR
jgi:hypothetical protein